MKNISFSLTFVALALTACGGPDMKTAKQAYKNEDYQTAYQNYNELAEFGLPSAKVELGKMYLHGRGVKADPHHALELFEEAAAEGDKSAARLVPQTKLKIARADLKSSDAAVRNRGRQTLESFAKDADDPEAFFQLGQIYEKGDGVAKNGRLADDYYRRAAENNHAKANYYRARLYQRGELVKRDINTSMNLYKQSGDQGFAKGYVELARLYERGPNGNPDYEKAHQYYKLAGQKGENVENHLKALQEKAADYKVADVKD